MPKFWQIPLPREQSNPDSRQDILRFRESRTVFWSNPGSREYPSRPCEMSISASSSATHDQSDDNDYGEGNSATKSSKRKKPTAKNKQRGGNDRRTKQ